MPSQTATEINQHITVRTTEPITISTTTGNVIEIPSLADSIVYQPSTISDKSYAYLSSYHSFHSSIELCESSGGQLVKVESQDELDFIKREIAPKEIFWIGAIGYRRKYNCLK